MSVVWITLTNGRRAYLEKSRYTWHKNLKGDIAKEIIVDDSGNPEYRQWLSGTYRNAIVVPVGDKPMGYTKAMQKCFDEAVNSGCDYVLHTEDDFLLNCGVDVEVLTSTLYNNKHLSQIILQRQPWYPWEKAQPTYMDSIRFRGYLVNEIDRNGVILSEHSFYWSSNPNVYPIEIAKLGWPDESNSELKFTKKVMELGYKSSFLGGRYEPNQVTHIGEDRLGFGH
jgi:hypothetical protein